MQAFNNSTFSCRTANFLANGISLTILTSQSKKREKVLTMFASFWNKFPYLCLRQVYGVFSPHIWPYRGLVIVKNKLTSVFFCASVLLLKINFVITLSKFAAETNRLRLVVPQPLWQCYDAIYHQLEDRRIKNWRQFVFYNNKTPKWSNAGNKWEEKTP